MENRQEPDTRKRPPEHQRMLDEIRDEVRYTRHYIGKDQLDDRVMQAMADVRRDQFVPEDSQHFSFANRPLSIGFGQTISQPYIVALMTDLLQTQPNHVLLEVGTGCGYQAAVLSRLVKQVHSIEILEPLAKQARNNLEKQAITNVCVHTGDGYEGLAEYAPYDGIIVTAAAPDVPPPLIEQLALGGHLVIPVGRPMFAQGLYVVKKDANGEIEKREILAVAFVPLTGAHGQSYE